MRTPARLRTPMIFRVNCVLSCKESCTTLAPSAVTGVMMMKKTACNFLVTLVLCLTARAQEAPLLFKGILKPNEPTKAEIVIVVPPPDIEKYISKVEQSATKNPKWFAEYSKASKPGVPLPFHENLGLTKEEYAAYIELWNKREYKVAQEVGLLLRPSSNDRWNIIGTGAAAPLSTLRFSAKEDNWKSSNGILKRLDDIEADPMSILGGWKGQEWRYDEETSLSKVKENYALGKTSDGKYALLVYRAQEITSTGTRLLDKSIVVRVALTAPKEPVTPPKAAPATSPKKTAPAPAKPKKK